MYAAKPTANFACPILPNRPIPAPPDFLVSLATPLESALPENAKQHSVSPIESTRFFQFSPFCANCAPVTHAFATLTKHTPCKPIKMNTSGKHHRAATLPVHSTNSYKTTYTRFSVTWSDHFAHSFAALHPYFLTLYFQPSRCPSSAIFSSL